MLGVGASGSLRSQWPSPWGTSASSLAARRRGWAPGASSQQLPLGDDVEPQVALERRQLETERGGELGAAVEGAAQLEEVQRLAERIGGRRPRFAMCGHSFSMTGLDRTSRVIRTNGHE